MALEPKRMLNAGVVVVLNARLGCMAVTVRVLPKPLKLAVVLLAAGGVALSRDWPKLVTVGEVGMARGLLNWNMSPWLG